MLPIQDENRPLTTPYVNYGLLLINIVVFFFFFLQGVRSLETAIINLGAIPLEILYGRRLWTLFSSMFMHADITHLFGNMLYLWIFGDNVEDAFGHLRYLFFYLAGGLIASVAHILSLFIEIPTLGTVGFMIPTVGASGAISAILGAYLILYPKARIRTIVFYIFIQIVSVPAYYYLGFWFLYQLMMGVFSLTGLPSGIAFWAHIGGFVAGVLAVKAFGVKPRLRPRPPAIERAVERPYVIPRTRAPIIEAVIEPDRVRVIAELPGVNERNISIMVSEWDFTISAEGEGVRYYGRAVLPVMVIPRVEGLSFKNGVLSFVLYRVF
ncbi:MAG: rhomboid family intramembrane serine protease [Candidatus Bathyarchaeia archaeon]